MSSPGTLIFRDPRVGSDDIQRCLAHYERRSPVHCARESLPPETFSLDQRVEVDSRLALPSDVVNGPEWSLSRAGARVVYTKLIDNSRGFASCSSAVHKWLGPGVLVPGSEDGSRPLGNTDPTDDIPLVAYTLGTRAKGMTGSAWQMLDGYVGGVIPDSLDTKGGRWGTGWTLHSVFKT